jgi:hypothetical protein
MAVILPVIAHPTPETTPTLVNYPPPTWLKHTPVFMLPYEAFDGPYTSHTDTKYLSVGLAQWRYESDGDQFAVSVKSWRKPNDRWSRESEEIPVHRQVDMTICLRTSCSVRKAPMLFLFPLRPLRIK